MSYTEDGGKPMDKDILHPATEDKKNKEQRRFDKRTWLFRDDLNKTKNERL